MKNIKRFAVFLLFVMLMIPVTQETSAQEADRGVITGDNVNVRDAAALTGNWLGRANTGDEFNIKSKQNEWIEIVYKGGKSAYIHSDFVDFISTEQSISILMNGESLMLDDIKPYLESVAGGDRVLVPFRAISESLGIQVNWIQDKRHVLAKRQDLDVRFEMLERRTYINGTREQLDGEPKLITEKIGGEYVTRTMIPLRFFAETFGADVTWDGANDRVLIEKEEQAEEPEEAEPDHQEDLPEEEVASARLTAEVDVSSTLNMRSGPGVSNGVVARLADGQIVELAGFSSHWAKIRTASGEEGYVHSGYLKISEYDRPFFQLGEPEITEEAHRTTLRFPKRGSFDNSINIIETSAGVALANRNISLETDSFSARGFGSALTRDGFVDLFINSNYHYVVRDNRNDITIDILPPGLEGKKIVIDAGHGDWESGGTGNGLLEKNINLDVSLQAERMLTAAGADVIMTRSEDVFVTLDNRVIIANDAEADLFISVHANAMGGGNTTANGSETFWYDSYSPTGSERIATLMQEELVSKLGTRDRGVFSHRGFRVIRGSTMPSTLIEIGFMTNKQDAEMMKKSENRTKSAEAIFDAVNRFYR